MKPNDALPGEEEHVRADRLLDKAKRLCLISRAIAVPQVFEPTVKIKTSEGESTGTIAAPQS